jgi:hypothetical protein
MVDARRVIKGERRPLKETKEELSTENQREKRKARRNLNVRNKINKT